MQHNFQLNIAKINLKVLSDASMLAPLNITYNANSILRAEFLQSQSIHLQNKEM